MYYTSTEEARSDLFLAAAWFLIGPFIVESLLFRILRLNRIDVLYAVLLVALPLVYTVLVPALLIRYRREPLSAYGTRGGVYAFGLGVVLALPAVLAAALSSLLRGQDASLIAGAVGMSATVLEFLVRFAQLLGMMLLAVYLTVKARDAFASHSRSLREGVVEIGRVLGIVAAAATALLLLGSATGRAPVDPIEVVLRPLAVAAIVFAAMRTLRRPGVTTRGTLLAPTVVLGLYAATLTFRAQELILGLWQGAILAGLGLTVAVLMETRRSALAPIGLGVTIAALTLW